MVALTVPHINPELARSARDHFQRFYAEPQSEEDGREMATNVIGFFGLLAQARRDRDAWRAAHPEAVNPSPEPRFKPKRRRSASFNQE